MRASIVLLGLLPGLLMACGERTLLVGELLDSGGWGGAGAAGSEVGGVSAAGLGNAAGHRGQQPPRERTFILGADISWVQEEEDAGTSYVDDGIEQDILAILRHHGFNYVRLRIFHDPSSPCRESESGDETCGYQFEFGTRAEPYCDLEHTLEMARRVKGAGLGLLLDFHYSDTWADPDDQNKPLAWETLEFDDLVQAVHDYARDTLLVFRSAGVLPDMVQIGNGITRGFLFPDGSSRTPGNFARFATLLKSAIAGARSVEPSPLIMLHIEKPDDLATSEWWMDSVIEQGVDFDIVGQSCYPEWQGTSADWAPTFAALAERYPDYDFVVAEYSQEKRAVNDILFELPDGRGLGSFIWEPTQWGETLFDREGSRRIANEWLGVFDEMAADYIQ